MENLNYLAFAMPAFFVFLYLEYYLVKSRGNKRLFKYESSVSNISIGIAERLINLFVAGSFYGVFYWVYDNFRLFDIKESWITWVALILCTDLVWYWYHRLGHEVNIFWAAHIVHHQSEEFNLTAAARITTIQAFIRTFFWVLLPLAGFPPKMVIIMLLVHGAYSFFTHTQAVKRIMWLEYIFITPSLHGVHHASDEKYLDKNYGDMFVFWDKLFGTFQAEEEKPNYGLTHPIKSYSFLWQHFHYYFEICESYRRATTWRGKWNAVFGSPAIMDQSIRPELEKRFLQDRALKLKELRYRNYITFQIALCVMLLSWFTYTYAGQGVESRAFYVLLVLLTLVNCGALLEQRRWIYYLEYARLMLVCAYFMYGQGFIEFTVFPLILLIAAEKLFAIGKRYQEFVLQTK